MSVSKVCRLLLVAALLCGADDIANAAPNSDVYGEIPDFEGIRISPDGQKIAHIRPFDGQQQAAVIQDFAGSPPCIFATGKLKIRELIWAPAGRLLIRLSPSAGEINRYVSIDSKCKNPILVFDRHAFDDQGLIGWAPDGKRLLWNAFRVMPGSSGPSIGDSILGWGRIPRRIDIALDVVAVDPQTGKRELVEKGNERTIRWMTDAAGDLRLRIDEVGIDGFKVFARLSGADKWLEVYDSQRVPDPSRAIKFVAMGPKPDTAYVLTRGGGDRRAAHEFDLRTATLGPLLFQHPKFDVDWFQLDAYFDQAVGVSYAEDLRKVVYIEPNLAMILTKLRALLPGEQLNLVTWARDHSSMVLRADGPVNPTGAYYFADIVSGEISKLGARYPSIAAGDIATVRAFSYVARDGLTVPAYLTLPPRSPGKGLALVVLPHGGPEARDTLEFDKWAQFLASRGYAVFQPQFRGSDGYGWAFKEAGRLQWGLKMQDDITDGVKGLIADGTVAADRICIVGWSYGGYAALAGLAFTPELYRCGVAGAGVSDLRAALADEKEKGGGRWNYLRYWPSVIGDPFRDIARLEATSPARHAAKIRAPLLLLHGKDDSVVRLTQSQIMARAMEKAKKPYELIVLEGDDHWLSHPETEKRVLRELERFLGQHLK